MAVDHWMAPWQRQSTPTLDSLLASATSVRNPIFRFPTCIQGVFCNANELTTQRRPYMHFQSGERSTRTQPEPPSHARAGTFQGDNPHIASKYNSLTARGGH